MLSCDAAGKFAVAVGGSGKVSLYNNETGDPVSVLADPSIPGNSNLFGCSRLVGGSF